MFGLILNVDGSSQPSCNMKLKYITKVEGRLAHTDTLDLFRFSKAIGISDA